MTDLQIARICHAANKALCEAFGDTSQKDWEDAENWQPFGVEWYQEADALGHGVHSLVVKMLLRYGWVPLGFAFLAMVPLAGFLHLRLVRRSRHHGVALQREDWGSERRRGRRPSPNRRPVRERT